MKRIKIYMSLVVIFAFAISCEDGFLEREPLDIISEDVVYNDQGYVESVLYRLYNYMPVGFPGRGQDNQPGNNAYGFSSILDNNTDIAMTKSAWIETWKVIRPGLMDATNNPLDNWETLYKGIYLANTILANIKDSELDDEVKARVTAEARFVKAFQYFDLARRYGAVPLIKELQSIDDELLLPRTPVDEIYEYIDQEFTAAAADLPSVSELPDSEIGRATKEAAWAFNGRAQLFAKNYGRSAELSKAVIDGNGYTLSSDYEGLFQTYGGDPEVIFEVLFNGTDKGHSMDKVMLPFSYRADWGSQCNPTQEFVDSYEMANGLPITDPASGYNPLKPYEGRDSRFYATVLYQGADFMGRKMDLLFPDGVDAPLRTGLHTITGYYIRKFMDQSAPFGVDFGQSKQSWIEMRLAEVLLNYAEAQNEVAGPDASVYDAINRVRTRAGQPDLPAGLSKADMFDRIVHERKIELALEGHRFWDLKRWGMGVEVLNNKIFTGMKVLDVDPVTGEMELEPFPVDNRPVTIYSEKFDLFPVPQAEIEKNPNLLPQNPGY
ncbi:RagB/SusD family nutrient uptake outer membrane protein [Zobellia galactanivorans]|uniref:RagB/SusD family nutrient uptake outer membrane protein n=1 Tax=Zobellia galactanivorans (strain DSM 12802 / CCUG 47099 / CIP 106680 / NCIMB 13871 / Dsij) TaxID=63186 RepID=UPI001C074A40|nr:RagB/SusD family nutrient uptake outer membrane protein [Zobellia galactanivorans]MBU3026445.1 RagB/SusD family nutrient uptake outer membrane protein [Zobellia galactanivorans]